MERGDRLAEVIELADRCAALTQQNRIPMVHEVSRVCRQWATCLKGGTRGKTSFDDGTFSEAAGLQTKRALVDLHARRIAHRKIADKEVLYKLFSAIGPRFAERPGGYTRILKTGFRRGDGAETALIELVERSTT